MAVRKPPPVSARRLERKVDQLADGQQQLAEGQKQLSDRVDNLNLNGSAPALKGLAAAAPALLTLAQNAESLQQLAKAAPALVAAVERDVEWATWWKVTRRLLNPFKPLGIAVWAVIAGAAATVIANLVAR